MPTTRQLFLLLACLLPAACAHDDPAARATVLLLGETHDNGEGHRVRVEALRLRINQGWRPAIAMEQFDREQQPALDAAMRECRDADCVVSRVVPAKSSWQWLFYKPVISLALEHGLPVLAANLSRADAGKVISGGFDSVLAADVRTRYGLDGAVPAAVLEAQIVEVRTGHCDMLPVEMLAPMARAQIARDVVMAETIRPYMARGVVLIAGNGHVRRDIAVPYWLRAQGVPNWSIGYLEQRAATGQFDAQHAIPAIKRPDPCASLGNMKGKSAG